MALRFTRQGNPNLTLSKLKRSSSALTNFGRYVRNLSTAPVNAASRSATRKRSSASIMQSSISHRSANVFQWSQRNLFSFGKGDKDKTAKENNAEDAKSPEISGSASATTSAAGATGTGKDPSKSDDGSAKTNSDSENDSNSDSEEKVKFADASEDLEDVFEAELIEGSAERISELEEQVKSMEEEVEKYRKALIQSQADMVNLQNMSKKDVENARNFAVRKFSRDVLTVADALHEALKAFNVELKHDHTSETHDGKAEVEKARQHVANLLVGVKLTEKSLLSAFQSNGIVKVDCLGQPFDPNVHEALFQAPSADYPPDYVMNVVVDGYSINGHVLRPAKVGVSLEAPPATEAVESVEDVEEKK